MNIRNFYECREGNDCLIYTVWMYVPWPFHQVVKMTRATGWASNGVEYESFDPDHEGLPEEVKYWFVEDESEED